MILLSSGYGSTNSIQLWDTNSHTKQWIDSLENPSFFIAPSPFLFAVSENKESAFFHSYQKVATGFDKLSSIGLDGSELCHLCYSPKHQMLYGACWGSGHLVWASVSENGMFESSGSILQIDESKPQVSRVHFCLLNKTEDELLTCNIGLDEIILYSLINGIPQEVRRLSLPEGCGPRHAAYSKDEKLLYVVTENSNEVLVYSLPDFSLIQQISTLHHFDESAHCSAICLSNDEKRLYVANRFANTITTFLVKEDGTLEYLLETDCEGDLPRHMCLNQKSDALLVAYQASDEIHVIALDKQGRPSNVISSISQKGAACIQDISKKN